MSRQTLALVRCVRFWFQDVTLWRPRRCLVAAPGYTHIAGGAGAAARQAGSPLSSGVTPSSSRGAKKSKGLTSKITPPKGPSVPGSGCIALRRAAAPLEQPTIHHAADAVLQASASRSNLSLAPPYSLIRLWALLFCCPRHNEFSRFRRLRGLERSKVAWCASARSPTRSARLCNFAPQLSCATWRSAAASWLIQWLPLTASPTIATPSSCG